MTITEKQISLGLRPAKYFDRSSTTFDPLSDPSCGLKVKYVNALRAVVAKRMPRNRCGVPIVSDVDLLLADEWEIEEALSKITK